MTHVNDSSQQDGFTAVELIVTLFIAVAFIMITYQLYSSIKRVSSEANQRSTASNLAYSNLRKYASPQTPTWFICDSSSDLKANPTAPGQSLESGSVTGSRLPAPVTKTVTAFAPYGCTSGIAAIKVEASITYGPANKKVQHATYITR